MVSAAGLIRRIVGPVDDLGLPIAYLAVQEGTPVYDRQGTHVGAVEHVLADEEVDIFHGVIIHTLPLLGRHLFADPDQIAELRERGVLLRVDRDELHEPQNKSSARHHDNEHLENRLQARLRRAWDWISQRV